MDEPLIWIRAIHFAATMSVTGTVFFRVFVAEPAFHAAYLPYQKYRSHLIPF